MNLQIEEIILIDAQEIVTKEIKRVLPNSFEFE
jgi:hypothetical protein